MTGGAANAFNQYFERKIDAQMKRTAKRRPLPNGTIKPAHALTFACSLAAVGVALLFFQFNIESALLALGTILFYSIFYTLYLKPNTPQNIVIGGAAGAMPPVIAWVAAEGALLHPVPWVLFSIIFLWTPPHFWALALYLKDDYKKVKYPMMPIAKGEQKTLFLIIFYTVLTVAVSLLLLFVTETEGYLVYITIASILGGLFIHKSIRSYKEKTKKSEFALFKYSILYLMLLFSVLIVEGAMNGIIS